MRSEVGMQWEGSVLNQASFFTSVLHEHCLTQRLRYRPKRQTTLFETTAVTTLQYYTVTSQRGVTQSGTDRRYI